MSKELSGEAIVRARVKRLTVVRLAGLALCLIGLAVIAGDIALPRLVGVVLVAVGLYEALVFPLVLSRRWRKAQP